jgi:hypothetical protein
LSFPEIVKWRCADLFPVLGVRWGLEKERFLRLIAFRGI